MRRPRRVEAARAGIHQHIWSIVLAIPRGRVSTYGTVARLAGRPGHARLTGYALHALPPGMEVPWHRVVNARGCISFPAGSVHWRRQHALLRREGVSFTSGRIDLRRYEWSGGEVARP